MTQFLIDDRVHQLYWDRYKADARCASKRKTKQDCCNMNDVYVYDTSEQQLHCAFSVFRYKSRKFAVTCQHLHHAHQTIQTYESSSI